ncbi:hypothetical protein [Streptomyces tibetensis]|uniref:Uncharacterized protein n=1 Tax=Streptomyces tibetensis TaxID=2382123 RepID=A0ABW6N5Z7_9ACTN
MIDFNWTQAYDQAYTPVSPTGGGTMGDIYVAPAASAHASRCG